MFAMTELDSRKRRTPFSIIGSGNSDGGQK